jgi:hypothetical protein
LDFAAKENGLTQSQEAERRLEASFANRNVLILAQRLALRGIPNTGLAMFIGEMLSQTTRWSETLGDENWFKDADIFESIEQVLLEILQRLRPRRLGPRDEARIADYRRHARLPLMLLELEMAGKRLPGESCPQWLTEMIEELGPLAQRLAPAEPPPPAETKPTATPKRRRAA